MTQFKLGRKARSFNPRVPHLSSILAGRRGLLAPPPASVDWTKPLPSDLSMMMNDTLGDCTCAGVYHSLQVWTANSNPPMDTEPDENVELVYAQACGYEPGNEASDQGGNEQTVLAYWVNQGIPIKPTVGSFGNIFNKLSAFIEVDPRHIDDVKRSINECGLVYIGFNVPAYLMNNGVPDVWGLQSTNTEIDGGHCVILPGYDAQGPIVISWGRTYKMTWDFFSAYVDEVYALVNADWVTAKGTTPGGLTLPELESQMRALKS